MFAMIACVLTDVRDHGDDNELKNDPRHCSGGLFALGAALWIGSRRQRSALSAQIAQLIRAGSVHAPATVVGRELLDDQPAPVARYLRMALPPTQKHIQEVRIRQSASYERMRAASVGWHLRPNTSSFQRRPASAGTLVSRVAPLLHVRVRDALFQGRGSGQVSLLSAFTVGADGGTPQMNSGSMHRYLAEAVWYPIALLPSPTLRWTAINQTSALATLTNHGVSVSLEFRFADTAEVTGIFTPARWGKFVRATDKFHGRAISGNALGPRWCTRAGVR